MTFVTLTCNGIEKSLGDWGFSSFVREWYNQGSDSCAGDLVTVPADGVDPFPFGSFITVQIGRTLPSISFTPAGAPLPNQQGYSGGKIIYKGYRMHTVRTASPALESLKYKFGNAWDFFFERTTFRKNWGAWNGQNNVPDWRDTVILGYSLPLLTGANNTVPNSVATNLMSIAQQIKEIITYQATQSVTANQATSTAGWPPGPQFQSDSLTVDANGNYVLLNAIANGAAIQIPDYVPGQAPGANGTSLVPGGTMLRAPLDSAVNITCAEAMRRMCRWIGALGEPVIYWDYTTAPPTLHVSTVDKMPSVNVPFAVGQVNSEIESRDDLVPPCVSYRFQVEGSINGAGYTEVIHDTAATVNGVIVEGTGIVGLLKDLNGNPLTVAVQTALSTLELLPAVQTGTFDFQGPTTSQSSATVNTATLNSIAPSGNPVGINADPNGNADALAYWTELFPELARAAPGTVRFANGGNPGTILSPNPGYAYRFIDGTIAPWMYAQANIAAVVIEATVTAFFSYFEQSTPQNGGTPVLGKQITKKECNATIKITNLPPGTYFSTPQSIAGEPVPFGLAGFIYKLALIPKFQGSFTIQETEVTDMVPPGNNFNLTGSAQAAWGTMNATPQSVIYSLMEGTTRLNFGVPDHLGTGDIVERQKVNHGPRWFNLISQNMVNTQGGGGGTALGANVPKQSASPGATLGPTQSYPSNLSDAETNVYVAGLPPGAHVDAIAGQGQQALPGPNQGPGFLVIGGAAGTVQNFLRASLADVQSIVNALNAANASLGLSTFTPLVFRAVPCCEQGRQGYRIVLSSQFITAANAPAGLTYV